MRYEQSRRRKKRTRRLGLVLVLVLLGLSGGFYLLQKNVDGPQLFQKKAKLNYDASVTSAEQGLIETAIETQAKKLSKDTDVKVTTTLETAGTSPIISAYVFVTNLYSSTQKVVPAELKQEKIRIASTVDETTKQAIATALTIKPEQLEAVEAPLSELESDMLALIPVDQLTSEIKLLALNDNYYLDTFSKGAVFREATFDESTAIEFADLKITTFPAKDSVLKVNMTGVTALTRRMLKKLNETKDPSYFGKNIASFLADADITHISNEVSFKAGCQYHNAVFCSHPDMIKTFQDSGVDLVEITGNHNNDVGSNFNTETINLYRSLGWSTFGGGLNTADAEKPYVADQKGNKVTFLGYNYPDSPNGGAIAGPDKAGANSFDFDKIKRDIETAKQNSQFVIVDIQFWECYAYPDGYVEFPECYRPIVNQIEVFRKVADLGANMVIGTQAHQPQTYELYNGTAIYYGLGNMYFEQIEWPGTERGIILTHYFSGGKLLQTKLTPTVYDDALQTRVMTDKEAVNLLGRLDDARPPQ